ncbi:MAG: ribulose-phosphate 3-epimerase [Bacteroidota bacterium]|nr:ribulose-phosphate 3-epimerase [Bacteroidota bacterium]
MSHKIAPSMLACDFSKLRSEIDLINKSDADWFHLDVMDGVFVPNISFGMPIVKSISKYSKKSLDVHLMICNPDLYIENFKAVGAEILTVHFEACTHLKRTIDEIKNKGMLAGVALNPHTNVQNIFDIANEIDVVCLMSVNPGFGGQKFIERTYKKLDELCDMRSRENANFLIQIDGGVDELNGKKLINHGADVLVAGSSVFNSKNPTEKIKNLKKL